MRYVPDSSGDETGHRFEVAQMKREQTPSNERKMFKPFQIIVVEYKVTRDALVWLWRERKNMTPRSGDDDY